MSEHKKLYDEVFGLIEKHEFIFSQKTSVIFNSTYYA